MAERILYDTHMHTPLCKHAVGDPEEYAAVAEQRGLKGIVVTCHNPDPNGWSPRVRMSVEDFETYVALVERARTAFGDRLDVRLGLESDFAPGEGMEAWLEELHGRAALDYVLGSVHCHLPQYMDRHYRGDVREFQVTYFRHLAEAAETGLYDCISHPDLVKNCFPRQWRPDSILGEIRTALDRIAASGVAMELNTSGLLKMIQEMNPGPVILAEMRARQIPIVIGSDAHQPRRVGADFEDALDALERAGYTRSSFFLSRSRREVSIEEARRSLIPLPEESRDPE